jgi:hypothetical protein
MEENKMDTLFGGMLERNRPLGRRHRLRWQYNIKMV